MNTIYLNANSTSAPKLYDESNLFPIFKKVITDSNYLDMRASMDLGKIYDDFKFILKFMFGIKWDFEYIITNGATDSLNIAARQIARLSNNESILVTDNVHNSQISYFHYNKWQIKTLLGSSFKKENIAFNTMSSFVFGESEVGEIYNLPARNCNISIDMSQEIEYYNNSLAYLDKVWENNNCYISLPFHKKLGLLPGSGILIYNPKYGPIRRTNLGGDGSGVKYGSETYGGVFFNSGTQNLSNVLFLIELFNTYDKEKIYDGITNYYNYNYNIKNKELTKITDFLHSKKEFIWDANHDDLQRMRTIVIEPRNMSYEELVVKTDEMISYLFPNDQVIYRTGKFCCDYYFEKNKIEGMVRFSV